MSALRKLTHQQYTFGSKCVRRCLYICMLLVLLLYRKRMFVVCVNTTYGRYLNLDNIYVCLSVCLSVCPSVRLSVCPSVRLSVCPSVRLSVCPSVRLSVCPSVYISLHILARTILPVINQYTMLLACERIPRLPSR